jgi:hypothetical protein
MARFGILAARRLENLLKTDRRTVVVFEGTFYGTEPQRSTPSLPKFIKGKLKGTQGCYGYVMFATRIDVTAIKQVEMVPASTPRGTNRYNPALFHSSSTRCFTSLDIRITPGQGRVNPSPGHLRVASIPIFEP